MTDSTTHIVTGLPEDFYEFLHNVIQDAQASGSIVNIITIIPGQLDNGDGMQIQGCRPKAETCPKT
ncbi:MULTISPECIES: hypothetical protein [Klebsiella pneumoniae complex]|uniref:hypothetical protein n=1 Tax=Klebsiella pneumoniae complex TaxID=3390273 RepID=UPI002180EA89|nr:MULTISPECIES: hypothetical protein [Klebsiella]MCZ7738010.1 hypothetical protein [Klebsiella pneumoniae]GKI97692.1 hypothetical protein NUKP18_55310 [Klebsiella variicola]HCI8736184.1 hypothetical protein [Klebsiella variicola]